MVADVYLDTTPILHGTTSDDKGKFRIENIPAGKYTLIAFAIGYKEYRQDININDNLNNINITLDSDDEVIEVFEMIQHHPHVLSIQHHMRHWQSVYDLNKILGPSFSSYFITRVIIAIVIFILFTNLRWFRWNTTTGLAQGVMQFMFSYVIAVVLQVIYFTLLWEIDGSRKQIVFANGLPPLDKVR